MTHFHRNSVRCHLGFDCGGLPPAVESLERSVEFKRCSEIDFARVFDPWKQDRSFLRPYAAPSAPGISMVPDAHGDIRQKEVDAFATELLQSHARAADRVSALPSGTSVCFWDGSKWITIGGYHIEFDGQRYQASRIVEDFRSNYAESRGDLPHHFESSCEDLALLPVSFFVSYPV